MNIRQIVRELRSGGYECDLCALEDDAAFIKLVRLADATPEPDWSQMQDWVQWWTVDPNGCVGYFEYEPMLRETGGAGRGGWLWNLSGKWTKDAEPRIDIPIGVDWRTLKRRRPRSVTEIYRTKENSA